MNIFKFFKEKKEVEAKKIQILKSQYQEFLERVENLSKSENHDSYENTKNSNKKCPKCRSVSIVDSVKRIQGEIEGSGSGTLFGFSASMSGSIDTNEINKCSSCGNEWKKSHTHWSSSREEINDFLQVVKWTIDDLNALKNIEFNPKDISEKYASKEEKVDAKTKEIYKKIEHRVDKINKLMDGLCVDLIPEINKIRFPSGSGPFEYQPLTKKRLEMLAKHCGLKEIGDFVAK